MPLRVLRTSRWTLYSVRRRESQCPHRLPCLFRPDLATDAPTGCQSPFNGATHLWLISSCLPRGAFQVVTLALKHLGYDPSQSERRCLVRKTRRAWHGNNHASAPADQAFRVAMSVAANVRPFSRGVLHVSLLSIIRLSLDANLVHGRSPLRC